MRFKQSNKLQFTGSRVPLKILQIVTGSLYSLDRSLSINSGLEKVGLIASDIWMETQLISATHSVSLGLLPAPVILLILFGHSDE